VNTGTAWGQPVPPYHERLLAHRVEQALPRAARRRQEPRHRGAAVVDRAKLGHVAGQGLTLNLKP
jgi:hypothetical protein